MLVLPFVLTQVETKEPLWVEADALRLKQVRGGATANYVGPVGADRVSIGSDNVENKFSLLLDVDKCCAHHTCCLSPCPMYC